jgi:flagellar basal-body rod modification protein FlgD
MAVAATGSSTTKPDIAASGAATLASSYDTFIKLLTTQLKNQDPLSPMDSSQFTQQLVQMTGVQQQLYSNDLLKQLVTNTGSGISTAVTLIGKDVKATSADTGLADGKATWNYRLAAGVSDLKVEVLDSNGKVVHVEAPSDLGAGDHSVTWNGKDLGGYQKANGGVYTLRITAKDSKGGAVSATPFVQGRVTGVEQQDGKTLITVNGAKLPWESVTSITEAAATSAATTTTTPNPSTDGGTGA